MRAKCAYYWQKMRLTYLSHFITRQSYSFGYNDDTCSPTSIYSMLNEIKAPKTVHCTYTNAHFNFSESEALASDWILEQVEMQ